MTIDTSAPAPPWVLREILINDEFQLELQREPTFFYPFLRPCLNRMLLVTDGILDFSEESFGLGIFVRTLLDTPRRHVRHRITLAHINNASPSQMMAGEARIVTRIPNFRFDDAGHFQADDYDVVMLFGIASSYGARGPNGGLADSEVAVLTAFMNSGGGLFATGDHGDLGKALGHRVPRVRNMRLWDSTTAQNATDQVSMTGPWRNDTNRGSKFDDQSDDKPQEIEPKQYVAGWFLPVTFPHPLLCGPDGVIRVMPDHPHEGQCVEPADHELVLVDGSPEYPPALTGVRPVPEVISTNRVPSFNRADFKDATWGHRFGGICAYDGHRAGIGRVTTDATWHHFVNVNLKGDAGLPAPYDKGFLTSAGAPHLAAIRAYYRNLAVWLSRPERIRCMNFVLIWDVLFDGRVLEAVLSSTGADVERMTPRVFKFIGRHARDVLGRFASQCQSIQLVLDVVLERAIPDLMPDIDPWRPAGPEDRRRLEWFDATPLIDVALGGILVSLRSEVGEPTEDSVREVDVDVMTDRMAEGGARAVRSAVDSMLDEFGFLAHTLDARDSSAE